MGARRGRRWGHTVLELMVVVAIIVIMLALTTACHVKMVQKARAVAGQSR